MSPHPQSWFQICIDQPSLTIKSHSLLTPVQLCLEYSSLYTMWKCSAGLVLAQEFTLRECINWKIVWKTVLCIRKNKQFWEIISKKATPSKTRKPKAIYVDANTLDTCHLLHKASAKIEARTTRVVRYLLEIDWVHLS